MLEKGQRRFADRSNGEYVVPLGLVRFREILRSEIKGFENNIKGAEELNVSRKGLRGIVEHAVGRLVTPSKKAMAADYDSQIAQREKVIEAINQGKEEVSIDYLIGRIEGAIDAAKAKWRISFGIKNGSEWVAAAEQDISILEGIDFTNAANLRRRLWSSLY